MIKKFENEVNLKEKIRNIVMFSLEYNYTNMLEEKKKSLELKEEIFTIIPELRIEDGFEQKNKYHIYDVWEHTLIALINSEKDLEVRMALLLHDIGKPYSYQEDEDGTRHFPGHAEKSAEIAEKILTRLGYEEQQKNNILYLIKNHTTPIDIEKVNESNIKQIKKLLHVQYCDAYAYNPKYTPLVIEKLDKTKEKIISIEEKSKEIDLKEKVEDVKMVRNFEKGVNPKQIIKNILMVPIELDYRNIPEEQRKILDPKETIFTIIPELRSEDGFKQNHPHHIYDVWKHTLVALRNSERNLEIRLALLLHDIGKPYSYQDGEDGVRHFKGHAEKSEEIARKVLTRLEYDEEQINRICFLIANHDTIIDVNNVNLENKDLIKKLIELQYCDVYAHAPNHIEERVKKLDEINKKIKAKIKELEEKGEER